jgi:hypothetical protein
VDRIGLICAPAPRLQVFLPRWPLPPHGSATTGAVTTQRRTLPPAQCLSGFVWRQAGDDDYVCVTPESRERGHRENASGPSRIDPHGAYGPKSCLAGFVWREAFEGDQVCVPPEIRALVQQENQAAPSRTAP